MIWLWLGKERPCVWRIKYFSYFHKTITIVKDIPHYQAPNFIFLAPLLACLAVLFIFQLNYTASSLNIDVSLL